ncbi:hypothetical protein PN823_004448 [Enterobacter hormaechei]|nr:hypothetical protein [Enterobacter hormaechei]
MDVYHKIAGDEGLFADAPPLDEVVLEDISRKTQRIIFAEAFRPGATWWHSDGRRGRRGLPSEQMSDYRCAATRTPHPSAREKLTADQLMWDLQHARQEPVAMYSSTRPCVSCGEPVADGMIHACKYSTLTDPGLPVSGKPCPHCGILGAHFCTGRKATLPFDQIDWHDGHGNRLSPKLQPDELFTSVFGPQHNDNWIRLNTAGRIKFSEALMLRYAGMKIDVAVSQSGRVRVGEADHGKVLGNSGYLYARRLVPLVEFCGMSSILLYLHEHDDGYLYGTLTLKDGSNGYQMA